MNTDTANPLRYRMQYDALEDQMTRRYNENTNISSKENPGVNDLQR